MKEKFKAKVKEKFIVDDVKDFKVNGPGELVMTFKNGRKFIFNQEGVFEVMGDKNLMILGSIFWVEHLVQALEHINYTINPLRFDFEEEKLAECIN